MLAMLRVSRGSSPCGRLNDSVIKASRLLVFWGLLVFGAASIRQNDSEPPVGAVY